MYVFAKIKTEIRDCQIDVILLTYEIKVIGQISYFDRSTPRAFLCNTSAIDCLEGLLSQMSLKSDVKFCSLAHYTFTKTRLTECCFKRLTNVEDVAMLADKADLFWSSPPLHGLRCTKYRLEHGAECTA